MKKILVAAMTALLLTGTAWAGDLDIDIRNINDDTFTEVVREAGMAIAYRGVAPAEPQGITGFDVGLEVSMVDIDAGEWDQVVADRGDAPDYLAVPRLHVRKGLPFNLDIGASYTQVPDSNIEVIGAELQWALLEGTAATPALSLRGSYSTLLGVDDLDLTTYAADAVVSKGFLMFTPYAGIGVVRINGEFEGDDALQVTILEDHDFNETRLFGGLQMSLALLRLTLDVEYSRLPVYTAKVSLGW